MMKKLKNLFNTTKKKLEGLMVLLLLMSTNAYADYDIGGEDAGWSAKITSFIQEVVNFIDGPIALAFSFFSLGGMALAWAVFPKVLQSMGVFLRVIIAVIVILNIGTWIAALQS